MEDCRIDMPHEGVCSHLHPLLQHCNGVYRRGYTRCDTSLPSFRDMQDEGEFCRLHQTRLSDQWTDFQPGIESQ